MYTRNLSSYSLKYFLTKSDFGDGWAELQGTVSVELRGVISVRNIWDGGGEESVTAWGGLSEVHCSSEVVNVQSEAAADLDGGISDSLDSPLGVIRAESNTAASDVAGEGNRAWVLAVDKTEASVLFDLQEGHSVVDDLRITNGFTNSGMITLIEALEDTSVRDGSEVRVFVDGKPVKWPVIRREVGHDLLNVTGS